MTDTMLPKLLARASRIPFVVLVGLVERLVKGKARIGGQGALSAEPVRFRHDPSLTFHATDLAQASLIQPAGTAPYVELTTTFAGLTGSASPMPLFFVEHMACADDDTALQRDFLDVFHHRFLGLLYRGLIKLEHPREFLADATDQSSRRLLLLNGLLPDHAFRLAGLESAWLLRLAPLMAHYPANTERLRIALSDVLEDVLAGAEVRVESFTGGFARIAEAERPRLGVDMQLGRNSALGRRVRSPASRIRISMGPVSSEACARLSPDGDRLATLVAITRLLVPDTIDVEVELQPSSAPRFRLGARGGSHLGRNTWLPSRGRPAPVRFRAQLVSP